MILQTKRGLSNKTYSEREGQTRFASRDPLGPTALVGGPRMVDLGKAKWHSGTSAISLCRPSALGPTETPGLFCHVATHEIASLQVHEADGSIVFAM